MENGSIQQGLVDLWVMGIYFAWFIELSPPVLMHGGLICVAFCLLLDKKSLDQKSLDKNSYLRKYWT